jgi:hypothetical protein
MSFGAHESFQFREGWLRKGLLGLQKNPFLFSDPYAGDVLGVGHNMVSAIRYWVQATGLATVQPGIVDGKKLAVLRPTPLAELILTYDPYLEEDGTLWVLHYHLATNKAVAPTWYWFFNRFGVRNFTQEMVLAQLQRYASGELRRKPSLKTLEKDFRCLVRTYARSEEKGRRGSWEETYDCPLAGLNLLQALPLTRAYRLAPPVRETLHPLLVGYALLSLGAEKPLLTQVPLGDALHMPGGPGRVFVMDSEMLYEYLLHLEDQAQGVFSFARTAGLNLVTFRPTEPLALLRRYYEAPRN